VKGYKAGNSYIEITDEDIEGIEVESTRAINVRSCRAPRSTIFTSTALLHRP
jgi:non-homologous end joining protein Ku